MIIFMRLLKPPPLFTLLNSGIRCLEGRKTEKARSYTIDLTRVKGDGSVRCPKCGVKISPEDTTEETYMVLEPVMKGNVLEKIVLQCKRCQSRINLVGFSQHGEN
ncbi:MAG: hypothetical protein QHH24_07595 [Candidatus Bathyarchaeota archaeon]|jgi:DNA-directed RNA polymerase subunit RPC12/RpoP|nr:hypothetical protein [Candidatus Bathyarchaeota archaeon]